MTNPKIISPITNLSDLGSEVQKTVEQHFDLKQLLIGAGKNQAQIIMVGPVVMAQSKEVNKLLREIALSQPPVDGQPEPLEYFMAKILRNLPAPRMKNLEALARNVARSITATKKDAALYMGLSKRTLHNHQTEDGRVKEIEK